MARVSLSRNAALLVVAVGAYAALIAITSGDAQVATTDVGGCLAPAAAAALCVWRGRSTAGRARRGWAFLGAAMAAWCAGQVVWTWYEVVADNEAPFPSIADAGYLLTLPLAAAGVLALPIAAKASVARARQLLDGSVVASALLLISWLVVLGRVVHDDGEGLVAHAISIAYPVGDLILVVVVVTALGRIAGDRRPSLLLLLGGLLTLAVADSAFTYQTSNASFATGSLVDVGWFAAFLLVGLAAVAWPEGVDDADDGPLTTSKLHVVTPYVPLVGAMAVATIVGIDRSGLDTTAVIIAAALVASVLGRQLVTLLENVTLNGRLELAIGALHEREGQLEHQAFHDPLTSLANRALFHDRAEHALRLRRREPRPLALLLCDLDDFKSVNDGLGHSAGDTLLIAVAERLRACVRPEDTVARLGGDEFAILIEQVRSEGDAHEVASRVLAALESPFVVVDNDVFVRASIGVAMAEGGAAVDELLRNADLAMYVAKGEGKNRAVSFETRMHDRAVDRLSVSAELIRGIENGELFLEFQPIQRISTGAVLAAEALVRWRHPTRGVLPPGMFIPIAEESTAITGLGRFVLDSAIAAVAEWRREDPGMRVTVNLSARQLHESSFIPELADCLQRHDVSGDALILELTETVLADDRVFARLGALGELGIALAIDDFGTGYSSFAYLQQFSVSYLKIDRSFIVDVEHDPQRRALVAAVVNMARTLDIEPVAEGVETEAQLRVLIELGCDLAQGYHLGRPAEGYAVAD